MLSDRITLVLICDQYSVHSKTTIIIYSQQITNAKLYKCINVCTLKLKQSV